MNRKKKRLGGVGGIDRPAHFSKDMWGIKKGRRILGEAWWGIDVRQWNSGGTSFVFGLSYHVVCYYLDLDLILLFPVSVGLDTVVLDFKLIFGAYRSISVYTELVSCVGVTTLVLSLSSPWLKTQDWKNSKQNREEFKSWPITEINNTSLVLTI